jgi:hypothetical protein
VLPKRRSGVDWFDWLSDLFEFVIKHWGIVWRVVVVILVLGAVYLIGRSLNLF